MKLKTIVFGLLLSVCCWSAVAQQTTVFTEANEAYKRGIELFDKGVYPAAQQQFQRTIDLLQPVNQQEATLIQTRAKLYLARCAVRRDLPDGEKLMLDFIRQTAPDPASNQALIELANYYFNAGDYNKAIIYYDQVPLSNLPVSERGAVAFNKGYAYFRTKKFAQAKIAFEEIRNDQGDYYYPTNYYLGMVYFFEGQYNNAIKCFRIVERSSNRTYQSEVPYYITQIYFAEGQYNQLLDYAIPKLNGGRVRKLKEIYQLVGQTYFELGQYQNALPYFEYYAERSSTMREEEFYQLGFVYMESNQPQQAIKYFQELQAVDSELGQNALYNLGRLYLQVNQKRNAEGAFGRASRMDYDKAVQDEAMFNYAKLAYELKDDASAIETLQKITPTSQYYTDAQALMGQILLDTRDYERALATLKGLPRLTPQLREALQQVTYLRGIQLLQQGNSTEAEKYLKESLETPVNQETKALALYWLGDITHNRKDYLQSSRYMNQFLTIARAMRGLPDESSIYTANYVQGYNYLKQENYPGALGYFQEAISSIKRNKPYIQSNTVKNNILGDAVLRAGDCWFKRNQYTNAIKFYDEAINERYTDFVYALYQKAVIEGLRGNVTEKILALERITDNYARSPYTDDALLQLGVTYQEIGRLDQAIAPLETLVQDYRNRSNLVNQGLIQLGLVTYNRGQKEESINYYKQVFSNNPEPSEAQTALQALEEIYVNDLGNADAYFAFLQTIPGYDVSTMGRDSINFRAAEAQFENGNYRKAIENYNNYIGKFPNGSNVNLAHYRRGDAYSALKLYSNALLDYEYVIGRGQSRYYNKALEKAAIIAYNHEQDFNRSYELYVKLEEVTENENLRLEAQLGAMRSAYRANLTNEVYQLSKRVSENSLASQSQIAQATFFFGKASFDRKDYDNALQAFEQVVQLSDNEETAEARYLIAYIYYLQRDLEKAQEITIEANRASSSYPFWVAKSVILLSDILAEKGDLFNARAVLEALLENYDDDAEVVQIAQDKLGQLNRRIDAESRIDNSDDFIIDDPNNN